jgi:hypothetical protein
MADDLYYGSPTFFNDDVTFYGDVNVYGKLNFTKISYDSLYVRDGATINQLGIAQTALVVNGDARITGILTVGTASITFDGNNNSITVGSGITFNGSTGIISATSFRGDGGSLTGVQPFPSGTLMLFQQTAAPTGWTKQTTHNDKTLRVVSGTASSGGTTAFTSVFTSRTPAGTVANTTLSASQLGNHTHAYTAPSSSNSGLNASFIYKAPSGNFQVPSGAGANTGGINEGSGGAHNHGFTGTAMDFAVQYVDLIIASKT